MSSVQKTYPIPGKSTADCYEAALEAYPKAGFEIWKKRELAYMLMAKCSGKDGQIDSNLMARFGSPTQIVLIVSAENLPEADLQPYLDKIYAAFKAVLG
jgi:hypothetical protein